MLFSIFNFAAVVVAVKRKVADDKGEADMPGRTPPNPTGSEMAVQDAGNHHDLFNYHHHDDDLDEDIALLHQLAGEFEYGASLNDLSFLSDFEDDLGLEERVELNENEEPTEAADQHQHFVEMEDVDTLNSLFGDVPIESLDDHELDLLGETPLDLLPATAEAIGQQREFRKNGPSFYGRAASRPRNYDSIIVQTDAESAKENIHRHLNKMAAGLPAFKKFKTGETTDPCKEASATGVGAK